MITILHNVKLRVFGYSTENEFFYMNWLNFDYVAIEVAINIHQIQYNPQYISPQRFLLRHRVPLHDAQLWTQLTNPRQILVDTWRNQAKLKPCVHSPNPSSPCGHKPQIHTLRSELKSWLKINHPTFLSRKTHPFKLFPAKKARKHHKFQ